MHESLLKHQQWNMWKANSSIMTVVKMLKFSVKFLLIKIFFISAGNWGADSPYHWHMCILCARKCLCVESSLCIVLYEKIWIGIYLYVCCKNCCFSVIFLECCYILYFVTRRSTENELDWQCLPMVCAIKFCYFHIDIQKGVGLQ